MARTAIGMHKRWAAAGRRIWRDSGARVEHAAVVVDTDDDLAADIAGVDHGRGVFVGTMIRLDIAERMRACEAITAQQEAKVRAVPPPGSYVQVTIASDAIVVQVMHLTGDAVGSA
jgi:hypothetical protein